VAIIDQVQRKKIIRDASTARNLVTSLLIVHICKRTTQRRSQRKQTSNPSILETRSRKV